MKTEIAKCDSCGRTFENFRQFCPECGEENPDWYSSNPDLIPEAEDDGDTEEEEREFFEDLLS